MIKMSVPASFAYSKDLSQTVRRTLALTNRGICKRFGIKVVPIVGEGTLEEAIELTRDAQSYIRSTSINGRYCRYSKGRATTKKRSKDHNEN